LRAELATAEPLADRWTPGTLRQGDLVGPLPYPKLKAAPQKINRPQGWTQDPTVNQLLEFPAADKYAVVVSHDCDFTEAKRGQFLLARVHEFSPKLTGEQREEIAAANDAVRVEERADERYEFLDTFVLDPLPGCFDDPMLVEFTTISSWPSNMAETIRNLKKAELEHEHRVRLRKKLGFFVGRDADDVADDQKIDAPQPDALTGEQTGEQTGD
jgi:hypothetical protein